MDTILQPYAFIIKKRLYEEDAIYLCTIHFGPKLYRFGFFATNDRTDIMSVDAGYMSDTFFFVNKYFPYYRTSQIMERYF